MENKRKSVRVRHGNNHLTIYPWTHPASGKARWRFAWRVSPSLPWRYLTFKTRSEAVEEAERKLAALGADQIEWTALDAATQRFLMDVHRETLPHDREAVLAYLRSRSRSMDVGLAVARFLDFKVRTKGEETRHLGNVRRALEAFAGAFSGKTLTDILPAELEAWHKQQTLGLEPKTKNELRGSLVAFWRWAILDGIYPREISPAEKLAKFAVKKAERRVLTREEFVELARHVSREFRPWLVLGAFAGLRPEEIAPPLKKGMAKKAKRGIRCEEIDWRFGCIRISEETSKVSAPRIVPLTDAARAWLVWAGIEEGMSGPVCLRNPVEDGETLRLGREVFGGTWPQNALRHSYGSYRNAMLRNLPQVAEEMGTSVAMLSRHYHNPRPEEEGAAWFALRPGVPIRSDKTEVKAPEIGFRKNEKGGKTNGLR